MVDTKAKAKPNLSKKTIIVIVTAIVLVAALGVGAFYVVKNNKAETTLTTTAQITSELQTTSEETTVAPPTKGINPLTGLSGFDENNYGKRPIAVVVENSPPARPQWGLCSPDIVIEGVAEGGITRMLWLYADVNTIPKVGPIRSARHDFVEMAEGLNAIFVHCGWSYIAEDAINSRQVDHINGLEGKYFFRDKSRNVASEHTLYTNGENIAKAIADKKIKQEIDPTYAEPFKFTAPGTAITPKGGACGDLFIQFSSAYKHNFKFDANDRLYYNYMSGKPMVEDGGKQMGVANVIVLYCPIQQLESTVLMEMDLTGGTGIYASNGGYEKITWEKGNTPNSMLKLFATDGSPLVPNTGKSYIGLVPFAQEGNTTVS